MVSRARVGGVARSAISSLTRAASAAASPSRTSSPIWSKVSSTHAGSSGGRSVLLGMEGLCAAVAEARAQEYQRMRGIGAGWRLDRLVRRGRRGALTSTTACGASARAGA